MEDGSPLQLRRVPTLRLEDPKVEWGIDESDIIDINGVSFLLLRKGRTSHSGFARLVYSMVGLRDRTWSLSTSVGYKELQKRRNDAQRANLETSMLDKMPTWQRSTAKVKVGRNTRSKLQELSEHRGVLSITVPGVNDDEGEQVEVVTPVHSRDELRVELDEKQIWVVLQYIVRSGFDDDLKQRKRDPTLPKYFHQRGDKIAVLDPATKRYKFYNSREGAEAAQEAPSDDGSQSGEPSDVDGGDEVGAEHGGA